MNLFGKTALVTGAAMGLGLAFAKALAKQGASVVLADIQSEAGKAEVEKLKQAGNEAHFIKLDVSNEDNWQSAIKDTRAAFGGLDILINNAGIAAGGTVVDTDLADWNRALNVNLTGVFLGCKHGIPLIAENDGGSVINISSVFGIVSDQMAFAYSASKGGVRSLTKSAALYCADADNGVRVNSIHPGFVQTPMVLNAVSAIPSEIAEPYMARTVGLVPLGRIAEPEDLVGAVLFLASDGSRFMTGSEVTVDGGFTAR